MTATVIFKNLDDGNLKTVLFSQNESLANLRKRWSDDTGNKLSFYLFKIGEEELANEGSIQDLPLLGGACIKINVEKRASQNIHLIGLPSVTFSHYVMPEWTPTHVKSLISDKLGLGNRNMQLLKIYEKQPKKKIIYEENKTLSEQGFEPMQSIFVDLEIEIEIQNFQTEEVRDIICFASDETDILLDKTISQNSQRIYLDGEMLEISGRIADDLIRKDTVLTRKKWYLNCEECFTIHTFRYTSANIFKHYQIDQIDVFARQLVHDIQLQVDENISYLGRIVNNYETFADIDVCGGGMLIIGKFVNILVTNSMGIDFNYTVERNIGVMEFRALIRPIENSDDFKILFNRNVIDYPKLKLIDCGVIDGSRLSIFYVGTSAVLECEGTEYQLGLVKEETDIKSLFETVNEVLGFCLPFATIFQCSCGKRISWNSSACMCNCTYSGLRFKVHRPINLRIKRIDTGENIILEEFTSSTFLQVNLRLQKLFRMQRPTMLSLMNQKINPTDPLYLHQLQDKILLFDTQMYLKIYVSHKIQWEVISAWPIDALSDLLDDIKLKFLVPDVKGIIVEGLQSTQMARIPKTKKETLRDCGITSDMSLKLMH